MTPLSRFSGSAHFWIEPSSCNRARLAGSVGRCRCKRLKIKIIMTYVSKLDKVALNLYTPQHVPGPTRQDQAEFVLGEESD